MKKKPPKERIVTCPMCLHSHLFTGPVTSWEAALGALSLFLVIHKIAVLQTVERTHKERDR